MNSTYVAGNTVRPQVCAFMSAHLMILGLILELDLPINFNHVSCLNLKGLEGIGTGERRIESIRCWQISNAIEVPDLRAFY